MQAIPRWSLVVLFIAGFALCAGCTVTVPDGNATATPATTTGTPVLTTGTPPTTTAAVETATAGETATPAVSPTPTRTPAGPGLISGAKWNDLDGDRRRDQYEPTLGGWTIVLEMQEANGPEWIEIDRVTTGERGIYSFAGLAPGHYRVTEAPQAGWTRTYPTNAEGMHNLVISTGQPRWTGQDFGNTAGAATATPATTPVATVTGTAAPTGTTGVTVTAETITARNLAFDRAALSAPAGATVVLTFVNDDPGVQHNVAFYMDASASTPIFRGAIATGRSTTIYTFTAPSQPGTYFFRCDVHPAQMTGSFVVT
jgi:plastocyanin